MNHGLLIKNAHQILTMEKTENNPLGLLENAWIFAEEGKIVALGSKESVMGKIQGKTYTEIDASGKTIAPGFIDCHTHVVFGGSRVDEYAIKIQGGGEEALKKKGIKTGIHGSVEMTLATGEEKISSQSEKRMRSMLINGTTTLESKSGYALNTSGEMMMLKINKALNKKLPLDIKSTFLGAHGWPREISKEKYIEMLVKEMIPMVIEEKLADYCDVWCDEGHYTTKESERILGAGKDLGLIPRIHTDAYSYIGGSDLAVEMKMASADHLNYTPDHLFSKLAEAEVTGVVLPGIEFAVNHPKPFRPEIMLKSGMTLALATNCCPGCWAESMAFILILACRNYGMSPEEAIIAATAGGAKALALKDRGRLLPGLKADIQIWDVDTYEDIIYKYGRNNVETVIVDGKIAVENGKIIE